MCEIFPWVDIGLMGGLWIFLAISQVCHLSRRCRGSLTNSIQSYFFAIISGYGAGQRGDHEKFNSMYSMAGLNSDPALANTWDNRVGPTGDGRYVHGRNESTTSDTGMLDNSYSAPPQAAVPVPAFVSTGHLSQPTHTQYNEYKDPYYYGAQGPQ